MLLILLSFERMAALFRRHPQGLWVVYISYLIIHFVSRYTFLLLVERMAALFRRYPQGLWVVGGASWLYLYVPPFLLTMFFRTDLSWLCIQFFLKFFLSFFFSFILSSFLYTFCLFVFFPSIFLSVFYVSFHELKKKNVK